MGHNIQIGPEMARNMHMSKGKSHFDLPEGQFMNPRIRHSFINEGTSNRKHISNPRFYNGGRYQHYLANERYHEHPPEEGPFEREAWTQRESRSRDGLHFGKGPKGYRKSDERILEDVNETLTLNPYLDASEIEVKVNGGIVTLSGTVSNREMKRLAEDSIELIAGINDIKNEIILSANL